MSETSLFRGHEIERRGDHFVFCDTREDVEHSWQDRPCGHCGRNNTPESHDACVGTLPGVMNACCGHGDTEQAYVQFVDGERLGGREALAWMAEQTPPQPGGLDWKVADENSLDITHTDNRRLPLCRL